MRGTRAVCASYSSSWRFCSSVNVPPGRDQRGTVAESCGRPCVGRRSERPTTLLFYSDRARRRPPPLSRTLSPASLPTLPGKCRTTDRLSEAHGAPVGGAGRNGRPTSCFFFQAEDGIRDRQRSG